jgi:hypothetical protein
MKALITFLSIAFILCTVNPAIASETGAGVIKNIKGPVFIERDKKSIPAKAGDKLFEKDVIVTGKNGSMGAILRDNSILSAGSNSRIVITEFVFKPAEKKLSGIFQIKRGTITYLTGLMAKLNSNAMRFMTPTASCGIRGTHFAIKVEDE